MSDSLDLLRENRNYRWTWLGQVVSEVGDHFNNVAVLALVIETTGSGLAVSTLMLARAIPAVVAGPVAAILPRIVSPAELLAANSLTQNTQSVTLTVGTALAGLAAAKLGYGWASVLGRGRGRRADPVRAVR